MQNIFNTRKNKISKLKIYRKNNTTFLPKEIPDDLSKLVQIVMRISLMKSGSLICMFVVNVDIIENWSSREN